MPKPQKPCGCDPTNPDRKPCCRPVSEACDAQCGADCPMPYSPTCNQVCPKAEAVPIVKCLHRKIQLYLNQMRFHEAWPFVQPAAAYYILNKPVRGNCAYDFGSIKQLFPRWMSSQTKSIIRGFHYFDDGSVVLHTIDMVKQDGIDKEQFDMYYYYAATYGCDYKLSYVTGRNVQCPDCRQMQPGPMKTGEMVEYAELPAEILEIFKKRLVTSDEQA